MAEEFVVRTVECTCASQYQDKHYGKKRRVAHPCKLSKQTGQVGTGCRCTVCGSVHAVKS